MIVLDLQQFGGRDKTYGHKAAGAIAGKNIANMTPRELRIEQRRLETAEELARQAGRDNANGTFHRSTIDYEGTPQTNENYGNPYKFPTGAQARKAAVNMAMANLNAHLKARGNAAFNRNTLRKEEKLNHKIAEAAGKLQNGRVPNNWIPKREDILKYNAAQRKWAREENKRLQAQGSSKRVTPDIIQGVHGYNDRIDQIYQMANAREDVYGTRGQGNRAGNRGQTVGSITGNGTTQAQNVTRRTATTRRDNVRARNRRSR